MIMIFDRLYTIYVILSMLNNTSIKSAEKIIYLQPNNKLTLTKVREHGVTCQIRESNTVMVVIDFICSGVTIIILIVVVKDDTTTIYEIVHRSGRDIINPSWEATKYNDLVFKYRLHHKAPMCCRYTHT
jgi:hypothetical protein